MSSLTSSKHDSSLVFSASALLLSASGGTSLFVLSFAYDVCFGANFQFAPDRQITELVPLLLPAAFALSIFTASGINIGL